MSHVNIVKKVKIGDRWRLLAIPKTGKGNPDWGALPEGRYYIEWYLAGKRRRGPAGVTASEALEAQRRKKHDLDGRELGKKGFEHAGDEPKKAALHVAVARYLASVETLKKPNTLRKYRAVLERFLEHFSAKPTVDAIAVEDLNDFIVALLKKQHMSPNTVLHNVVIIAQFFKRQGRPNITRDLELPGRISSLPREYTEEDLSRFFAVCQDWERALFSCFLFIGLRDQEMVHLLWSDVNFQLRTIRVTSKPKLAFYPKRWEEREIPIPAPLAGLLREHPRRSGTEFVFPSPAGNREFNLLLRCKDVALRAELDPSEFDLKTFRSTFATRMLRAGFDVRTVQHWMGHKSLETTMRYLVPATEVHDRLDQLQLPGSTPARKGPSSAALPNRAESSVRSKTVKHR